MQTHYLAPERLDGTLAIRDLTDPDAGDHAMQRLLTLLVDSLTRKWGCQRMVYRACPVVSVADNYDRLGYPVDGVAREARYTRYLSERLLLRTHTSAAIPGLLRSLAQEPPADLLLVCPGLVYRRDVIDRTHVGEPHQVDIWRIAAAPLAIRDLEEMIGIVVDAVLPAARYRTLESRHPYTEGGRQVDVLVDDAWLEIGECGLAAPTLLAAAGLPPHIHGLAMGLGLDRLLMIRKGIDDIRLLRSTDPRVSEQMLDLAPYRAVSRQPATRRDLSLCVAADCGNEELAEGVRQALGGDLDCLEALAIVGETPYDALPPSAHTRMGMLPGQKNVLVRLTIRHSTRTLTGAVANRIRDRVYLALHQGRNTELAGGRR